jgi:hypothetical protein
LEIMNGRLRVGRSARRALPERRLKVHLAGVRFAAHASAGFHPSDCGRLEDKPPHLKKCSYEGSPRRGALSLTRLFDARNARPGPA